MSLRPKFFQSVSAGVSADAWAAFNFSFENSYFIEFEGVTPYIGVGVPTGAPTVITGTAQANMINGDAFGTIGIAAFTDFAEVGFYWEGQAERVVDVYWSPSVEDVINRGRGNPDSPEGIYVHALEHGTPQEVAAAALNLPSVYGDAILRQAAGYGISQNSLDAAINAAHPFYEDAIVRAAGGASGGGGGGTRRGSDDDDSGSGAGATGGGAITTGNELSVDAGIVAPVANPPGTWSGGGTGTPDPGLPINPDYVGIQPIILDLDGDGVEVNAANRGWAREAPRLAA